MFKSRSVQFTIQGGRNEKTCGVLLEYNNVEMKMINLRIKYIYFENILIDHSKEWSNENFIYNKIISMNVTFLVDFIVRNMW